MQHDVDVLGPRALPNVCPLMCPDVCGVNVVCRYGLSVLVGSREAFLVAILCHSIHTVLVLVIEEPHKHRMYKRQQRAVPPAKSD